MECFKNSIILQKSILWSAVSIVKELLMEYNIAHFASLTAP